jgi:CheY-like chemotaxis protein
MDPPAKTLVVDDTPQNIRLLEAILTSNGYDMTSSSSGPDALAPTHLQMGYGYLCFSGFSKG